MTGSTINASLLPLCEGSQGWPRLAASALTACFRPRSGLGCGGRRLEARAKFAEIVHEFDYSVRDIMPTSNISIER